MDKGIARNTAAAQDYLDRCHIVIKYYEHPETPEYLSFEFEGEEGWDDGGHHQVWFDEDTMSDAAADAFRAAVRRAEANDDVKDAIKRSIQFDQTIEVEAAGEICDALMVECDSHDDNEYWGTLDGDEWRVRVVSTL